ncbi:hypothetical protein [Bacillus cihuensis]|uniref:hypothetical protein n=1 Tax=Bacillus cihuensis TaxID=1208599 RepID=UPI001377EA54|nr:hypothetical protein [Bacillus cihuensis]
MAKLDDVTGAVLFLVPNMDNLGIVQLEKNQTRNENEFRIGSYFWKLKIRHLS